MASKEAKIEVQEMSTNRVEFFILGRTPIILNRMSEKAKYELLFPKGRKTAAEKATSLKHNPRQEFRDSPYTIPDEDAPTLIAHLATSFKAAIRGAGVDVPGATKAQLGRLMWVEGERIPIYGEPRLHMAVTRSADELHRVELITDEVWSLFLTGPKEREWGFLDPDKGWMPWYEYLGVEV